MEKPILEVQVKKTGKEYDFNQIHYLSPAYGVEGLAAQTLSLSPKQYPYSDILVNREYEVDFDQRGFVVNFELVK